ncbi:hypothetical protein A8B75_18690 [Sphingomonadales bacterium EhC05]|nr:hypothetical protein A8B75_18690 [Sphingomonadales bacterium EhC05]
MLKFLSLPFAIFAVSACSTQPEPEHTVYKTLHIENDNSASNLASSDEEFAKVIARRVAKRIADLPLGSYVSVRTFGDVNGDNNLRYKSQITRKSNPAETVARNVARYIVANAQNDKPRQGKTEIISTLTWGEYNCSAGDEIILLSDGIPSGRVKSPLEVVNGEEALPEPEAGILSGCSVAIWSLGRTKEGNLSSVQIDNLRSAWEAWVVRAGGTFSAITNP